MRSRILATLAMMGLLMTAIPLTASANDQTTCSHEPAWGYRNPNLYRSWRQMHCGYGYNQNYFGSGQNYFGNGQNYGQNYFGNGGGWRPGAPAYSQYEGPRYYNNNGWRNDYRANRGHDWRQRFFHHDHFKGHHDHH